MNVRVGTSSTAIWMKAGIAPDFLRQRRMEQPARTAGRKGGFVSAEIDASWRRGVKRVDNCRTFFRKFS